MAPLITLTLGTLLARGYGAARGGPLRSWRRALALGLALMFTVTGMAHFFGLRADLVAMVPPALPRPDLLVTLTGLLELAGAVALLRRRTEGPAALVLTGLLVGIFPANVYAAVHHVPMGGDDPTPLLPRTLLQVVFVAATITVALPWVTERLAARRPEPEPAAYDALA